MSKFKRDKKATPEEILEEVASEITPDIKEEAEKWAKEHKSPSTQTMQAEFTQATMGIFTTMRNPFASRDKKRQALCKMVDGLTKDTFITFVPQIIEIINRKKEVCEEYNNTEEQVDDILKWLPRMKEFRDLLVETVKLDRQKYGLKI